MKTVFNVLLVLMVLFAVGAGLARAQEQSPAGAPAASAPASAAAPESPLKALEAKLADAKVAVDTVWVLAAAILVFFMNLGFAMLETGLCRAKNAVSILAKNFIVFAVSSVAFLLLGFAIMFGDGTALFGTQGFWFLSGLDNSPATGDAYQGVYSALNWTGVPLWAKFFFQLVFAGTAATIVSGAVAERIKFDSFYVFSFFMVAFIYPVVGHWIWGSPASACGTSPGPRSSTRSAGGRRSSGR